MKSVVGLDFWTVIVFGDGYVSFKLTWFASLLFFTGFLFRKYEGAA